MYIIVVYLVNQSIIEIKMVITQLVIFLKVKWLNKR